MNCPQCHKPLTGVGKFWVCPEHGPVKPEVMSASHAEGTRKRLFLSYGRRDAKALADRLSVDLTARGFEVWQDTRQIRTGTDFMQEIQDGLRSTQLVIALLSPHSVRVAAEPSNPDHLDSVCLDELSFARFACKVPIVPVMAEMCEPPFCIFRLDYVDLCRWQEAEDQYQAGLARMLDGIEAALRGEIRYRAWERRLQPLDFAAHLNEKRQDFCGRRWLFEEIDAWRCSERERALLITGDPGIGKSAIVAQLVHLNPLGQVLAYHCCRADTPNTLRAATFVQSLAAMIASRLPEYSAQLEQTEIKRILENAHCTDDPASAFEEGILTPLEHLHAPSEGVRYILIDALDEALALPAGERNVVDLLAPRLARLPGWLRIVATTRKDPVVLQRLGGLRAHTLDAQDRRNLDDLDLYILQRLQMPNLAERLQASRVERVEVQRRLREAGGGNFLYIQQILQAIERDLHTFDHLDALPRGLPGIYDSFFRRQFPTQEQYATARDVLQVVVAARQPLTVRQMALATGLHEEDDLPDVLECLAAYLPEREGQFAVYHKSLADWLMDRQQSRDYYASPRRGHERLAEMCWSEYQRDSRSMSPYALRHLPAHLIGCEQWERLGQLLTALPFLEAKAEARLVFDLAGDLGAAVQQVPPEHPCRRFLTLLEEAIRRDIHFIARYPTTLFQCLWNTCWWFDCPEAAQHYDPPEDGWSPQGPPWERPEPRLSSLLGSWRAARLTREPGLVWLASLHPPAIHLGTAQRALLRGHDDAVLCVACSPDGQQTASGANDQTIRVWNTANGRQLLCLRGHEARILSVAWSPDGRSIVSAADDRTVRIWEVDSGRQVACLRGHEDRVRSAAFSPDGQRIVSGSSDRTVRVWDRNSGQQLVCLRGHEDGVRSVAWSPDGQQIVAGARDKSLRIWLAAGGQELACLRGHERGVWSVAWSSDSRRIVSGSTDQSVRVWDARSGQELICLRGHEKEVTAVAWSPDGLRIISGGRDQTIRVWDAQCGLQLACLRGHEGAVNGVAFATTGWQIVSGASDGTVRVWEGQRSQQLAPFRGHKGWLLSSAFSPDGRWVVSGGSDRTVRVWDARRGEQVSCLSGHEGWVTTVAWSPDSQWILSGAGDQTVRVWEVASGRQMACISGHESGVWSVDCSPEGRRIVSGANDQTVCVWNLADGGRLRCFQGHEDGVMSVAWSADGRQIASGSGDQTVRLWDAESGEPLRCLRGHEGWVHRVAFSPDGRRIASGAWDGTTRIWDVHNSTCLEVIEGNGDAAAIAAGSSRFPWRALRLESETIIVSAVTGERIAWFPTATARSATIPNFITTHPSGRVWAGPAGALLDLFRLEGA